MAKPNSPQDTKPGGRLTPCQETTHPSTPCPFTLTTVLENQKPYTTTNDDDTAAFELASGFLDSLDSQERLRLREELADLVTTDQYYQCFDDTCALAYDHILSRARTQDPPKPDSGEAR